MTLAKRRGGSEGTDASIELSTLDGDIDGLTILSVGVDDDATHPHKTIIVAFQVEADTYVLRFVLYDETLNAQTDVGVEKEHDTAEYPERQRTDGRA